MRCLYSLLLMLLVSPAFAQQKKVLYYKNGKKALEGDWRISGSGREEIGYMLQMLQDERSFSETRSFSPIQHANESLENLNYILEGTCTFYYPNGKVMRRCTYNEGIPQGHAEWFHPNGKLMSKGTYKDGMPDGYWEYFDKEGYKIRTAGYEAYRTGELDSVVSGLKKEHATPKDFASFYSNSEVFNTELKSLLSKYTRDLPGNTKAHGKLVWYSSSQEREAVLEFAHGILHGETVLYEQNELMFRAVYENGTLTALYNRDNKNVLDDKSISAGSSFSAIFRKPQPVSRSSPALAQDVSALDPGLPSSTPTSGSGVGQPASEQYFSYVEQMPVYPGDLNAYLSKQLRYPPEAVKEGVEGRVVLRFVVTDEGNIKNVEVLRGINAACDKEAIRVISNMPKWKPGRQNGRAVSVFFTLPVVFKLNSKK